MNSAEISGLTATAEEWSATRFLAGLTLLHFLVDAAGGQLSPLWPALEKHYQLGDGSTFWLIMIWTLATSFSQLAFGLMGAHPSGPQLIWLGPVAAAICLGSLGQSSAAPVLITLLVAGGLGIASFHPEAATQAGNCWPANRSRAMSIFATGGFLGQAVAPAISGSVVDEFGLTGLSRGIFVGLPAILLLWLLMQRTSPGGSSRRMEAIESPWAVLTENRRIVSLLLLIGTLRVIASFGAPTAVAYWLDAAKVDRAETGSVQSAFMLGIGLGGLACAMTVARQTERFVVVVVPLLSVPLLAAVPWLAGWLLKSAMFGSGLTLGIALPVFITLGQDLLPASRRIGSSLTMGVSWGTGGVVVAALIAVCRRSDNYGAAFAVFAGCVVISSVLLLRLAPARSAVNSLLSER